jgi:3-methyl-2-oxobutanoate hydroxymethyltransferase
MGHLGLTPQSVNLLGGFRPQGKTAQSARRLLEDAQLLQDTGCFSIVLESVPARLATVISERLTIPTIGIGAGAGCDGQVLVTHDLLGLFERSPKFAKRYANLREEMLEAFSAYISEVQSCAFPAHAHTTEMPDEEWQKVIGE